MKHVKLNFYKSSMDNLVYKIFRFKNENKDLTTDYFINTSPDFILDELRSTTTELEINDYNTTIINEVKGYDNFFAISSPFDMVRNDSVITINFKNNPMSDINSRLRITFGTNVISKVEHMVKDIVLKVVTNLAEIEKLVKIYNPSTILLNTVECSSKTCTVDLTVNQLSILDDKSNGIFNPIISILKSKDYFILYQELKHQKNIYYYKSIAYNDTSITEISETRAVEITEDAEDIKTIIECSDNYNTENPTWNEFKVEEKYNPLSEIKIYKNEIASKIIKNIYEHEIYVDDRLLLTNGLRVIKLPNIWHKDRRDIMQRPKKVFRIKNTSIEIPSISSPYSKPIVFDNELEILIDKMVILKRNVTGLPDDVARLPLTLNDIKAEPIKIYVRQGGIYYKDYIIGDYETNNVITYKDLTSSVTLDSRFPIFSIKDNCIYSNKYNYTVYLFDETGNMSEPVSIVV